MQSREARAAEPISAIRLVWLELVALGRSRMLLGASALIFVVIGFVAVTGGSQAERLHDFLYLMYGGVPAAIAAIAAAQIPQARSTRSIQAIMTARVTKGRYYWAKAGATLMFGAFYLAATVPFIVVLSFYTSAGDLALRYLAMGGILTLLAVALGSFVGTLFVRTGPLPPAALAFGIVLLSGFAPPLLEDAVVADPVGANSSYLAPLFHLSPHVQAMEVLDLMPTIWAVSVGGAVLALGASLLVLLLSGAWTFARAQEAETWEARLPARILLGSVVALVLVLPGSLAPAYETRPEAEFEPAYMKGASAVLVERGTPAGQAPFGAIGVPPLGTPPFAAGDPLRLDLLILLADDPFQRLVDVQVEARADRGMSVEGDGGGGLVAAAAGETARIPAGLLSPHAIGPVVRVPVTIHTPSPEALAFNVHLLEVSVRYALEGAGGESTASAGVLVVDSVPHAQARMALAAAGGVIASLLPALARAVQLRVAARGGWAA